MLSGSRISKYLQFSACNCIVNVATYPRAELLILSVAFIDNPARNIRLKSQLSAIVMVL